MQLNITGFEHGPSPKTFVANMDIEVVLLGEHGGEIVNMW